MHPHLFGIIESYAVMMIIGILAAVVVFELYFRLFLKVKSSDLFYLEMPLIIAIVVGIIGAYLTQNIYDFIQDPSHYQWSWSMTFYGGLIFGIVSFLLLYGLWARKHYPGSIEKLLIIAPACIALGHGFGRLGCFLAGCCYGMPTEEWFGIQFETTSTKVIPTNLFEALFLFVLFGVFLFLALRFSFRYSAGLYLIVYSLWRFLIEFARGDYRGAFVPGLTPSQFWSILLGLLGIGYIVFQIIHSKNAHKPQKTEN